jgi:hypothetical protein
MPPRHHYWTIILEGKPTAFRAHTQEELQPTLRQLQSRHPDAVMKWFARGRLWLTQEEERADAIAKRRPRSAPAGERRTRDWRPGGSHQDPRDRFKIPRDEKRRRFAQNLRRDRSTPPQDDTQKPEGERALPADRHAPVDRPRNVQRPASRDRAKSPWNREKDPGPKRDGWKPGDRQAAEPRRFRDDRRPQGQRTSDTRGPAGKGRGPRPPGRRKPGGGGGNRGGGGGDR